MLPIKFMPFNCESEKEYIATTDAISAGMRIFNELTSFYSGWGNGYNTTHIPPTASRIISTLQEQLLIPHLLSFQCSAENKTITGRVIGHNLMARIRQAATLPPPNLFMNSFLPLSYPPPAVGGFRSLCVPPTKTPPSKLTPLCTPVRLYSRKHSYPVLSARRNASNGFRGKLKPRLRTSNTIGKREQ